MTPMTQTSGGGGVHGPIRFPLRALIARYTAQRQRRGTMSADTAARTERRLSHFAAVAPDDIRRVTRRHIEHYIERPDRAIRTRRLWLYDLRAFFRWAVIEGHVKRDPTLGVEPPEQPESVPGALLSDDDDVLRTALPQMEDRIRLIFSLERNEALRRVELARAQIGDIDRRARLMRVRGKAKGGRGGPTRTIPISDETLRYLDRYLASEQSRLGVAMVSGPLFRNRWQPSSGISGGAIGMLVTKELYRLGIKQRAWDGVGGHALRHTAATEAANAGTPEKIIQEFLGHADPSSTQIYTRGAVRDLRRFHNDREALREADTIDLRDDDK